ncbi:sugar-transfer associated ATP-grasp domain-containing protein [Planococcus salinarum]|uniref:sugar-transfer associated ATP-grasp domain-containing protein n=1 Tax=Planococcus salinarum TaxID=622695 RepID=UPI000E3C7887|nr:sugar-transfer associated ATP-grasp domain-containing protein [Planococcus salinarum]TAA72863.1 hypothetical protein D2909_04535 [Planococcus salinarum]
MGELKIRTKDLILYNAYFLVKQDYKLLNEQIKYIKTKSKKSYISIILDMMKGALKRGISYSDYCYLQFYSKNNDERNTYIGTAEIYEFQKKMNDKSVVKHLNNKILFNEKFKKYVKRESIDVRHTNDEEFNEWLKNKEILIAKPSEGTIGGGIEKINLKNFRDSKEIKEYLNERKLDLLEEFIVQNNEVSKLNPDSVNTIRIITVLDSSGKVNIIDAAIRMSVGKVVDNFNAGGISAPIDVKTGKIIGPAVSKDIKDEELYYNHPKTKEKLIGFQIPHWGKILQTIEDACYVVPEVRTVGWDIAVLKDGVLLVEGNHNWCKCHYQQSFREGKKELILSYYDK